MFHVSESKYLSNHSAKLRINFHISTACPLSRNPVVPDSVRAQKKGRCVSTDLNIVYSNFQDITFVSPRLSQQLQQIVVHRNRIPFVLLAQQLKAITLVERHCRRQCIHRHKAAASAVVGDKRMLHKVQDVRTDVPMLGIHVHTQTSNLHGRIVAAMLAVRETVADSSPSSLVRFRKRDAVVG